MHYLERIQNWKAKYKWKEIKHEFITANLALGTKGVTLRELALKHGKSNAVIWNKSSKDGWLTELAQALKEKNVDLSKQVQGAAVKIDKGELLEEYKVRTENYKIPTIILGGLKDECANRSDEEIQRLPLNELVKGIAAFLKAREQAAGLPKFFKPTLTPDTDTRSNKILASKSVLDPAKKAKMLKVLKEIIDTRDGKEDCKESDTKEEGN